MEWTQSLQILTGSRQTDVLSNDLSDIDPVSDLVNHVFGNQSSAPGSHNSSSPSKSQSGSERIFSKKLIDQVIRRERFLSNSREPEGVSINRFMIFKRALFSPGNPRA